MKITNDIKYVGVNDRVIDLFEGQYVVPNGMSYNSYVIVDEKVAVMDTVDKNFTHQWLSIGAVSSSPLYSFQSALSAGGEGEGGRAAHGGSAWASGKAAGGGFRPARGTEGRAGRT